jgi:hypothetical protein
MKKRFDRRKSGLPRQVVSAPDQPGTSRGDMFEDSEASSAPPTVSIQTGDQGTATDTLRTQLNRSRNRSSASGQVTWVGI